MKENKEKKTMTNYKAIRKKIKQDSQTLGETLGVASNIKN